MTTNKEIRQHDIDVEELPRDNKYVVMAARPRATSEPVSDPIEGRYHAMYLRDRIEEEYGYAGVTFHIEEA